MRNCRVLPVTLNTLIAFVLLAGTAMTARTQQPVGPPSDRTNPDRERQQDMNRREMLLRGYGLTVGRPPATGKKLQALADQVEQDFNRILILHNEIVRAISGKKGLEYGFVSDTATEIRKRALRLQSTLALKPVVSELIAEKQMASNDAEVKVALIALCRQIKSFVTNPVIENPGTVQLEQVTKAREDLQRVIELSLSIKRATDILSKNHK